MFFSLLCLSSRKAVNNSGVVEVRKPSPKRFSKRQPLWDTPNISCDTFWFSSDTGHRWTNLVRFLRIHRWFCFTSEFRHCYWFEHKTYVVKRSYMYISLLWTYLLKKNWNWNIYLKKTTTKYNKTKNGKRKEKIILKKIWHRQDS